MPKSFNRRWVRFSLRGLLIAITIASMFFGWRMKKVRDVDNAVAAINRAEGEMRRAKIFRTARKPSIQFLAPRPYWRRIVSGEGEGEWAVLTHNQRKKFTDAGLSEVLTRLRRVEGVTWISLADEAISHDCLNHLAQLSDLKDLAIIRPHKVVETGWRGDVRLVRIDHLTSSHPDIDRLRTALPRCNVNADGRSPHILP